MDADVIVVGAGLAGLVAAAEAGRRRPARCCWSTRRASSRSAGRRSGRSAGCSSSTARSSAGWASRTPSSWPGRTGSAAPQFDRDGGPLAAARGPRRTSHFAAGEKRSWLREMGHRLFPVVGWAERGDGRADGHGNSVPRFHITWGTGPGRRRAVRAAGARARRDRPDPLRVPAPGRRAGRRGRRGRRRPRAGARADDVERGQAAARGSRSATSSSRAQAVIVTSGGIGGDHDLVRKAWPERLGTPPKRMVAGVPAHVDGRMLRHHRRPPARNVINPDRMWHYVEGLRNWDPIWENHGIRILPGPSSLWLDATGTPAAGAVLPGLRHARHAAAPAADRLRLLLVRAHPEDHREGVRALRLGAEPRPHRQGRQAAAVAGAGRARPGRSRRSSSTARTSSSPTTSSELVAGMNTIADADVPRSSRPTLRDADRGARPRDRQRVHARTPRSPRSAAPATTAATS